MIRLRYEPGDDGGITAPIIQCDHCQEEITDCRAAILLWLSENPSETYQVHKGNCDRRFEDGYAREHGLPFVHFPWMSLDRFLDCLTHNAGLSAALRARKERAQLIQTLRRRGKRSAVHKPGIVDRGLNYD